MKLNFYGRSDIGLVRTNNEDCALLLPERSLFAVCDGMGGHSAGEVASRTAAGAITAVFNLESEELRQDPALHPGEELPRQGDLLVRAIRLANRRIHNRASVDSDLSGMGTTIAAVAFEGNLAMVAHVGDSRAYVYRDGKLRPLTIDHSWVAEAVAAGHLEPSAVATAPNKNVITRALGVREAVEVDIALERVMAKDLLILCTDGLCGFAGDAEIANVVYDAKKDPRRTVENLIRLANDRGGLDNVSVVAIEVVEPGAPLPFPPRPVVTIPLESVELCEREDEWLETLAERVQAQKADSANRADSPAAGQYNSGRSQTASAKGGGFLLYAFIGVILIATALLFLMGKQ